MDLPRTSEQIRGGGEGPLDGEGGAVPNAKEILFLDLPPLDLYGICMGMALRYLFVDMNSYFASVEQEERPELRGKPVAVVPVIAERTSAIAASCEAKGFGVKTGTSVADARLLCPHIQFVLARPQLYVQTHHRIIAAIESCLHVDHVCSIDEMYGQLLGTERLPQNATAIALKVKEKIREVGSTLRCSIGIASNPWLAKIAADLQKPDGLTLLPSDQLPGALFPLKLTDLPGIGRAMLARLQAHGIFHVEQLCSAAESQLAEAWGSKVIGSIWHQQLRGIDLPYRSTKRSTVSHSHVLAPELRNDASAYAVAQRMLDKAAHRMRLLGYHAQRLTLSLRFLGRGGWASCREFQPCRDSLALSDDLRGLWRLKPAGNILKVGVDLSQLVADPSVTIPLFDEQVKRNALADVMDRVKERYGRDAVHTASMLGVKDAAPTRIAFNRIPADRDF
jgi:DNA polymerase-4